MDLPVKWIVFLASFFIAMTTTSSLMMSPNCPKGCFCNMTNKQKFYDSVKCTSQEIFSKLCMYDVKQSLHLHKVDLSASHMSVLNTETLNKLIHLHTLNVSHNRLIDLLHDLKSPKLIQIDLSSNRIRHVSSTFFPKSIQIIDLSDNKLQVFPQNLQDLTHLREFKVSGNVFECTCRNWEIYDSLITSKVEVDNDECLNYGDIRVYKWEMFKSLENCGKYEEMLGDEAGSGDGEALDFDAEKDHNEDDPKEFIPVENEHHTTPSSTTTESQQSIKTSTESDFDFDEENTESEFKVLEEDGSGSSNPLTISTFEGSGHEDLNITSWPSLDGSGDSSDDEDQNITIPIFQSAEITVEPDFGTTTEAGIIEDVITVKKEPNLHSAKHEDDNINEELGQHFEEEPRNVPAGTFIFIGILSAIAVILIVVLVCKRRSSSNNRQNNNNRRGDDEEAGSELKEMDKVVPLLNHENGKTKPLTVSDATPMIPHIDAEDVPFSNGFNHSPLNGMDLGDTTNGNHVVPSIPVSPARSPNDPERVKITMTELTDSIPKTPVHITRTRSNGTDDIIVVRDPVP